MAIWNRTLPGGIDPIAVRICAIDEVMKTRFAFFLVLTVGVITLTPSATGQKSVDVPKSSVEQTLYDKGQKLIDEGRFEVGRFTLQTMVNLYPKSSLIAQAEAKIRESWVKEPSRDFESFQLYERAQAKIKAGNLESGRLGLQTLINLYPKSAYAPLAHSVLDRTAQ